MKSATPSTPSTTASPSITNRLTRFFSAASTIHVAAGPVVAALCDQTVAVAVALQLEAITIVFDLVQPIRGVGDAGRFVGMQKSKALGMVRRNRCKLLAKYAFEPKFANPKRHV